MLFRERTDTDALKLTLAERYAWPGGYPMYGVSEVGYVMCWRCGSRFDAGRGDPPVGVEINYEDRLFCDYCGDPIESAYEEDTRKDD